MNIAKNIPKNIASAVDTLISPYGLSIERLLNKNVSSLNLKKKYLSVKEAEKYCGIGRWSLYRLAKSNKLKVCKLSKAKSGKVLIEKDSLDEWLESCKQINDKLEE